MEEAAAWAGPRFQLTHSAAEGSRERAVLCAACGVLPEDSETQWPSVLPGSVSAAADRKKVFCNLPTSSVYKGPLGNGTQTPGMEMSIQPGVQEAVSFPQRLASSTFPHLVLESEEKMTSGAHRIHFGF